MGDSYYDPSIWLTNILRILWRKIPFWLKFPKQFVMKRKKVMRNKLIIYFQRSRKSLISIIAWLKKLKMKIHLFVGFSLIHNLLHQMQKPFTIFFWKETPIPVNQFYRICWCGGVKATITISPNTSFDSEQMFCISLSRIWVHRGYLNIHARSD